MTEKEIIGILKESSLWKVLSEKERSEAVTYALGMANPLKSVLVEDEEYLFNAISENYSYYLSAVEALE